MKFSSKLNVATVAMVGALSIAPGSSLAAGVQDLAEGGPYAYQQRVFEPAGPLVAPAREQAALARFRAAYEGLGRPRVLILVNRTLNEPAALKPTLADRQTMRDVERLFGRPLRRAGAVLIDSSEEPVESTADTKADTGPASLNRDAAAKIADVVIEVLVSSRRVAAGFAADGSGASVPDIQATAIRLSDTRILGQAAASDVLGGGAAAVEAARRFEVSEIVEATAIALLEDVGTAPVETK